jgi:hypothetical protein
VRCQVRPIGALQPNGRSQARQIGIPFSIVDPVRSNANGKTIVTVDRRIPGGSDIEVVFSQIRPPPAAN